MPTADAVTASARKAELMSDPEWRSRYIKGPGPEREELAALHAKIAPPAPAPPVDPGMLNHVRDFGVSDEVVKQIETQQPVSRAEYDATARWKAAHLKDPAFREKALSGDYDVRKQLMLANVILSSPIKEAS
jgi:hypothetical protein